MEPDRSPREHRSDHSPVDHVAGDPHDEAGDDRRQGRFDGHRVVRGGSFAAYRRSGLEKATQSDAACSALMTRFHHGTGFLASATKNSVNSL